MKKLIPGAQYICTEEIIGCHTSKDNINFFHEPTRMIPYGTVVGYISPGTLYTEKFKVANDYHRISRDIFCKNFRKLRMKKFSTVPKEINVLGIEEVITITKSIISETKPILLMAPAAYQLVTKLPAEIIDNDTVPVDQIKLVVSLAPETPKSDKPFSRLELIQDAD